MEPYQGELGQIAVRIADCLAITNNQERALLITELNNLVKSELRQRDSDARAASRPKKGSERGGFS